MSDLCIENGLQIYAWKKSELSMRDLKQQGQLVYYKLAEEFFNSWGNLIGFVCDILKYGIKNDEGIFWLMRWMRKWVILVKINDDELEFYSVLKGYEFGGAWIQI